MKFLFTTIDIFGIKAPWFSWVAALSVIVWPTIEIYKLIVLSRLREKQCNKLISDIRELCTIYPIQGGHGLNSVVVDRLRQMFEDVPFLNGYWNAFRVNLIYRSLHDEDDAEQVWQKESAASIFPDDVLLGNDFNKRHFHSIPGIVTGIGLLMTFAAILVGLLEVRIIDNKVHGLENLIGGLSGKFISSVAALLSATVFLIFEKNIFHRLIRSRLLMVDAIDLLLPVCTESHLLNEISENISEQTRAFRIFNADLALKLRNSFSESVGPTLERMVDAIDNLNKLTDSSKAELLEAICEMNQLLKKSEQSRYDSISGQVESLIMDLQKSLSESIDKMSKEFSRSLTGTTQDQFSKVADTVNATAEVLERMNNKFTDTQTALHELISLAKESTESQISSGYALIERMVNVLGDTMVQMEEKISELSVKMTNTIEGTAERSAEAAGEIISEVKMLNEQTAKKIVEVLEMHEKHLDRIELLKQTLQDSLEEFGGYVTGYNQINNDLKMLTRDANAALQVLSQSSINLKEGQNSFAELAELASNKIQLLAKSNEKQKELWAEINASMEIYKSTFATVEKNAAAILSQLTNHIQNFSNATQDHFNKIITVADDHVSRAVGKLGVSIEELSEKIDDLGDVVSEIDKIYNKFRK